MTDFFNLKRKTLIASNHLPFPYIFVLAQAAIGSQQPQIHNKLNQSGEYAEEQIKPTGNM